MDYEFRTTNAAANAGFDFEVAKGISFDIFGKNLIFKEFFRYNGGTKHQILVWNVFNALIS